MRITTEYRLPTEPGHPHPGLEALEDGFCMVDRGWRVLYWNAAAERMLGADRASALGRNLWDLVPFLREGPTWDELHEVARDGTPRRFLDAAPPTYGSAFLSIYAAPAGADELVIQLRDATEDVRAQDQYGALLESIHDGFVAADESWRIVYINAAAEALLRFPQERAIGVSLWPLLPRGPREIRDCLRATMADGIRRHLREVRPEGRVFRGRVFDIWTHPLAGGGVSILFEDVSSRVGREIELARYAARAEEANAAKTRFVAAVSHELRTPLNAIMGYAHLLAANHYGALADPALRATNRILLSAEHLARLVDDLLLLTTTEIGRAPVSPTAVDLGEFLPSVLEAQRLQAEAKGLRFTIEVAPDLPALTTDGQRLRQLLVALVSNAVKFTPRGTIRVEAALCGEEPGSANGEMEIRVADSGPGISAEDRERIFLPFEQVGDPARSDSMTRGTGLGLTVASQIAALLRGSLELSETSPEGSCFRLRLPMVFADSQP